MTLTIQAIMKEEYFEQRNIQNRDSMIEMFTDFIRSTLRSEGKSNFKLTRKTDLAAGVRYFEQNGRHYLFLLFN